MMNGYDKQEAIAMIVKGLSAKDYPALTGQIETLISQAIDADMAYMHAAGVLDEDGNAGDSYYDDDDALDAIVEALEASNSLSDEQAAQVAALAAEYMDLQQAYLEQKGLVDWE